MKHILGLTGIMLAICSIAAAQESTGDRVVVPARNSTRPRKIVLRTMNSSAVIRAYNGKEVIVETRSRSRSESGRTINGMRRIDLGSRGLTVEEEDNVITIHTGPGSGSGEIMVSVPADTSVFAESQNGGIEIDGLRGEFELQAHNGRINANNVSGTVMAHSQNGEIKVSMDKVDPGKPIAFSTLNGNIDVTLPADWKANVKLKTNHGEIWSDFDFKLGAGVITQQNNSSEGKFRVTMDRAIVGTVNGGGPEATFTSLNGKIFIKKK